MDIGYFQFLPEFLKVKDNLSKLNVVLKHNLNKINKLDLVVFPEYFLSGPLKLDLIPEYEKETSSINLVDALEQISKNFPKQTFVMGSILLKKKKEYFNTTLAIKNGKILVEYHKKALIYGENYVCRSDNKIGTFNVKKLRLGLAICWDLILPEIFRSYVKKIDLMIIPSFWGIAGNALQSKYSFSLEKKYYTALGLSRAYENSYSLLFVNSVGKYKSPFYSDRMMGGSYFVNPPLGIIHKTNNKNPDTLHTVTFNKKYLDQYKEYYATDKDYLYYKSKKVI